MINYSSNSTVTQTAKGRYERLLTERNMYTDRAEKCAKYTIPMLFPKESDNYATEYYTPYQSMGARGVNNLVSKLMLALFPPNAPFFRLVLSESVIEALGDDAETIQRYEEGLSKLEKKITSYMETHQIRTTMYEALAQLVVAGNVLLFLPPLEGGARLYKLNSYVIQRDGIGTVIEIITKESMSGVTLPEMAIKAMEDNTEINPDKQYEIYTHVYLEGDTYKSYQEIEGKKIKGTEQEYPIDSTPWIACRLRKMDGENYGRSYVDDYLGDLKVDENLSKSVVEVAAIAANILYLVNPNSMTRPSELNNAKSGQFVKGRPEDIQVLQVNKTQDLQITTTAIQNIESRLSYAFLLNSAVQRNAERVTAEEIRYVANELEDTVGSIYSILSQELQLPLVRRFITQMMMRAEIPDLILGEQGVMPLVVTGIEALGRGHDLSRLDTFIRYAQVFPEAFQTSVKQGEILRQIATSLGIDANSVVKSDMEIQQEQQQAMQMQMAQQATPEMVRGAMQS